MYIMMWLAHIQINIEIKKMNNNAQINIDTITKTMKMSQLILLAFGLFYVPLLVPFVIKKLLCVHCYWVLYLKPWSYLFGMFNSLANPIIYILRLESVRNELTVMISRKPEIPSVVIQLT